MEFDLKHSEHLQTHHDGTLYLSVIVVRESWWKDRDGWLERVEACHSALAELGTNLGGVNRGEKGARFTVKRGYEGNPRGGRQLGLVGISGVGSIGGYQ